MHPNQLIADYQAAFAAEHHKPGPRITYEHGWFRFPQGYRYRRSEVVKMRDRLRERTAERKMTAPQPAQSDNPS